LIDDVQNRVVAREALHGKQSLQSTVGSQLVGTSKTLRPGNDTQHEAHKYLARLIMIRTFGLVELSTLELLDQADPPKKFA
jgi:hypothetical protein